MPLQRVQPTKRETSLYDPIKDAPVSLLRIQTSSRRELPLLDPASEALKSPSAINSPPIPNMRQICVKTEMTEEEAAVSSLLSEFNSGTNEPEWSAEET